MMNDKGKQLHIFLCVMVDDGSVPTIISFLIIMLIERIPYI